MALNQTVGYLRESHDTLQEYRRRPRLLSHSFHDPK